MTCALNKTVAGLSVAVAFDVAFAAAAVVRRRAVFAVAVG